MPCVPWQVCVQKEAAKSDSKFSSSSDLVDANVSLNERKNGEKQVSGGLCVLVFYVYEEFGT